MECVPLLYWFPLALSGLQETVLLISRMSFVTLHLCALKILWSEYKKALALFCTPDTACLSVVPKQKRDLTDHLHYNLYWHQSSNAVSQISDLCDSNIYCPYNSVLRTM